MTSAYHWTALDAAHLPACVPLWKERHLFTARERHDALAAAASLLDRGLGHGAMIFEGSRPRAFGLTTFVRAEFLDGYLRAPHPMLGRQILLDSCAPGTPVLGIREVARGNARDGLHLVVLLQGDDMRDESSPGWDLLVGTIIDSFLAVHRGFRLQRVLNEVYGAFQVDIVARGGSFTEVRQFDLYEPEGQVIRSGAFVLGREDAVARRSPLLPLFTYSPPRICFTPPEQQLLRAALGGMTDEGLRVKLGVATSTVKARWTRIQQRVSARLPELHAHLSKGPANGRGPQTRHLILDYVRRNPSELTPHERIGSDPPARRASAASKGADHDLCDYGRQPGSEISEYG